MAKNINVGGQAVIEGVMMRGSKGIATAVRTAQGEIVVEQKSYTSYTKKNKFFGLPIVRGFISLIESLVIGVQTLNYSASFFEEEGEDSKLDKWIQKIFKEKSSDVIMGISLVISLIISIGLFFILPTLIANLFSKTGASTMGMNIVEGIIRVLIFLLYVYLIGKMEDINRVYQYHGAEHKTIFCYENNIDLTPENAAKFGRLHPRCGTNFLFLVMIVSIIAFSLTGWNSIGERVLYRIVLLPLISGISYEIIKWMGKSTGSVAKFLSYPGLKLQNLTTREPDLSQIEVAIRALKVAEGIEV
jgi:uncharacterized protein YqhQ